MKNRYFIIFGLLLVGLFVHSGCGKATNVVAPNTATVTVTAIPGTTLSVGSSATIRATVQDGANNMNGIGVRFMSSNPSVASFSSSPQDAQVNIDAGSSGVVEVNIYGLSAGSADISADITNSSGSVSLTVE